MKKGINVLNCIITYKAQSSKSNTASGASVFLAVLIDEYYFIWDLKKSSYKYNAVISECFIILVFINAYDIVWLELLNFF